MAFIFFSTLPFFFFQSCPFFYRLIWRPSAGFLRKLGALHFEIKMLGVGGRFEALE
jgi:hypothetical protein